MNLRKWSENWSCYRRNSTRFFPTCLEGVTLWLLNHCFRGQKWKGNMYFEEIFLTDFHLDFYRALTHAFDSADQTTERGISKNWILRDFFTSPFYPWERTKRLTSREISFLLKSPFNAYIPTFWDLYSNSYVWFEQNTNIWAIVEKTIILAIAVPFQWGITHITQEGSFSSSDRIDQKLRRKISKNWIENMARTHSGNKYAMLVWSCVNGHFTGKRHWDRVKLVQVLTWFRF